MKNKLLVWAVISMSGSLFVSILSILFCHWERVMESELFVVAIVLTIVSIITTIAYFVVVVRWRKVEQYLRDIYNYHD